MSPIRPGVPGSPLALGVGANVAEAIDRVAAAALADGENIRRSLPDVAADVMQLCQMANVDAFKIEKAVTRDPFITAQLISLANSAMFAPRTRIVGVRDAVVRIGLDAVRDIVMMAVTSSTMYRVPGFETQVDLMRRRGLATAVAAKVMAKTLRVQAEYAFMAGLLHDIGELVLLERCVKHAVVTPALMANPEGARVINDRVQHHHTEVGANVCRIWKLPVGVIDAAAHHHQYKVGDKHFLGSNLVAAADLMVDHIGISQGPRQVDFGDPTFVDLGLTPEKIDPCIAELKQTLAGMK